MIICPECGAQSPEESIHCDNCGAALQPGIATAPGLTGADGNHVDRQEAHAQEVRPGPQARRRTREKTPEWLKGLEDPWDEGLAAADGAPPAEADSLVPHWLRGPEFEDRLTAEDQDGGLERAPATVGPGEIPAWLREFDEPAALGQADAQPVEGGLTPVWLAHLDLAEAGDTSAEGEPAAAPEWLADLAASESVETVDIAPSGVAGVPGEEPPVAPAEQPETAEAVPDSVTPEVMQPVPLIPEWLRVLDIAAIQATLVSPADARAMKLLNEAAPEEESKAPAEELPATEDQAGAAVEEGLIGPAGEEGEAASMPAAMHEEEVDEFTAWLRALTMATAVRSVATPESETAGPADERARLLAEVDRLFYGAAGTPPDEIEAVDPLPQWLDEVLRSVDEFSGEENQVAAAAVATGVKADWLVDGGGLPTDQDEAEDRAGAGPALAGAAALTAAGIANCNGAPAREAEADALAEAELPEWLVVARQGEMPEVGALAAAAVVAESGPLAGIPGVLEREPGAYELQPAIGAATEPALSPEQRQQLAILQQLGVDEQESAAEAARPGMRGAPAWLQPAIALLLLAVIVIGLLSPRPVAITPSAVAAAEALSQAVAAAAGQPVLVAFEYSPAMAGELSPMAGVLLADLAANGSGALLVSQSGAGITLGESLATQTSGLSSSSIGYLPGEVIGLRQLAGCLSDPTACEMLGGEPVDDALRQQMADVALIVVLAAERDALVSWVEQVSPVIDTPIYAGLTQAVAPLAAPYQNSGQLASVLAGYPAAVAYEQALVASTNGGPIASQAWAYTLALWLAAAVIVAGAIYWLAGRALRRGGGGAQ